MEDIYGDYSGDYLPLENETFDYANTPYIGEIKKIPLWEIVVKSYLYAMIIFFSLVGNTLIIIVVLRNKRMRTTTNYYIVNLAVADILVTVFCTWVHLVNNLNDDNWVLGGFFCKFNTFSQVLCLVASVLSLTLIAYDRFFGIVFALKAHMTNRKARGSIAVIWICSLAIAAPLLRFRQLNERKWLDHTERWCDDAWPIVKEFNPETNTTFEHMPARTIYFTFVSGVLYFFPMIAMTVAYSVIIRKLSLSTIPGERVNSGTTVQQKTKRKVIAMLVTIMSVFGICWLPYQIVLLYAELRTSRETLGDWFFTMQFLAGCFAYANSALNPLIYAGFNENFKQAIILMKTELGSPYILGSRRFSSRFSMTYFNTTLNGSRRFSCNIGNARSPPRASEGCIPHNGLSYSSANALRKPSMAGGTVKSFLENNTKVTYNQQMALPKRYIKYSPKSKEVKTVLRKQNSSCSDDELNNSDHGSSSPMMKQEFPSKSLKCIANCRQNEKGSITNDLHSFVGAHFDSNDGCPSRM